MSGAIKTDRQPTWLFGAMVVVGLLAFAVSRLTGYEPGVMRSVGLACLSTGLLGLGVDALARYRVARRHPEWLRLQSDAQDERSVKIRHAAGNLAFQVLFVSLTLFTLLSPTRAVASIHPAVFGPATLILMSLTYWTALLICSRRE